MTCSTSRRPGLGAAFSTRKKLQLHKSLDLFTEFVTGWDIVQSLVYLGQATAAAGDSFEARRIYLDALYLALEAQATSLAPDALVGLAHLQARAGEAQQALELSICVLSHSASTQEAKDRAQQLRTQLESQLTPQQVESVQARTQAKTFAALVTELLNSSPRAPGEGCEPSQSLQEH
jgi:paraquat-inducible protein B